jgi:hypothetical protein
MRLSRENDSYKVVFTKKWLTNTTEDLPLVVPNKQFKSGAIEGRSKWTLIREQILQRSLRSEVWLPHEIQSGGSGDGGFQ